MRVRAAHAGALLPFERDRRLVLRRLPVGALITRATLTLTPVSTDPGRRFLETLTFPSGTGAGDWGATKRATTGAGGAVEIDLHARRRLASMTGSSISGAALLVDLGGGFLPVAADGGLGAGLPCLLANSGDLPGLTVTGLRIPQAGDVSLLRVSSPPSNLTVAVEGGPVFFSHFGDLVESVTTPDLADVLQAMLADLDVENGSYVLPLVVHSDSIARLDVDLDLELDLVVSATPEGVGSVTSAYRFDGTPLSDGARLSIEVPPGMVAVERGTTGRVQGAFAATRVVHGPLTGANAAELVPVEAGRALAQPLVTAGTEVVTSIDVLLTAVTASVALAVDLVDDLDGKPGRASLLSRPADLTITRDTAGSPTWVNVALPAEVEVDAARRHWLVVQARTGSARWSASGSPAMEAGLGPGPAFQQTRDGGLSWRAVAPQSPLDAGDGAGAGAGAGTGLAAELRLRHTTVGFHMPLELRVGAGDAEVGVSVAQFQPSGTIDFELDFPEVASAVNAAIASGGGGAVPGGGERVANGDFADWYRVGTTVRNAGGLPAGLDGTVAFTASVFSADGARVLAVGRGGDNQPGARLVAFDALSREPVFESVIGDGSPLAVARDPAGRQVLVATAPEAGLSTGSGVFDGAELVLIDAATGRRTGTSIPLPELTVAIAASADGRGVYLAGADRIVESGLRAVVRQVDWVDLAAAAAGSPIDWGQLPRDSMEGLPLALATAPDGRVVLLVATPPAAGGAGGPAVRLISYSDRSAVAAGDSREVDAVAGAVGLACPPGDHVLVLAEDRVRYVRATDLATVTDVVLGAGGGAHALALDPDGVLAVIARSDGVGVLDVPGRRMLPAPAVSVPDGEGALRVSVSPAGTHAALTRTDVFEATLLSIGDALPVDWELTAGHVQPISLPATGEVLALLGQPASFRSQRAKTARIEPAAISQVVPVVGGARYRLGFDAIATTDGAIAQVRWRGDECRPERTDRVPISPLDVEQRGSLDRVPRHDRALAAPAGATQAEIRFFTPEGLLAVDRVTLSGSADIAGTTWETSSTTTTVTPADTGFTLSNGGSSESGLTQVVAATAGDRFDLQLTATASGEPGALLEFACNDETGTAIGPVVRVGLSPLDFDARAASGVVPGGAVEAVLAIVLPPGAIVELAALHLTVGATTEVGLYLASEAPGELSLSDVAVTLDRGEPQPLPVPPGGMCPATPTGEGENGEACYCQACGARGPAAKPRPVRTEAGRPAVITSCPTCGTPRIRLGGRPVLHAEPVALPRFRALDRAVVVGGRDAPAIVSRLRVDVPVTDIAQIGEARAKALREAGIGDVVSLARAEIRVVAALPGVSDSMAEEIVASADELVRTRGRRVLFE